MIVTKDSIRPLHCLVVDDEPIARDGIVDLIEGTDFLSVTATCSSAMEAIAFIKNNPIDLLFLDVNMPYLSGMDMLETLDTPPLTILTTAYSEYAVESYRLQVVDYLLKPISFKRFYQAALKAKDLFNLKNTPSTENKLSNQPYVFVKQNDGFVKVDMKEICYIEAMENYVKVITSNKSFIAHQTMQSMEELLSSDLFFRIHRSYLVNLNHIHSITAGHVVINNCQLPIARNRKKELMESIVYRNLLGK
ncbi:LytR/AlgR family response regulator transcription factor [Fulvivirga sediminis]|uniref:Response regulator transcription factor n=1 Tax=Fulvivirga sediminis TaxID=2803949 RepID=A0A937FAV5_9BACT|nr:LytTR family DNA-binding domain-containing protein [Fulvivirga sediminis]MBL3657208.1 response regulator transcription factor [Fulvivirga sediminis]